ncbi:LysM peptidoglycan-binding domain-containing protein [Neobacillus sp. LXY-4]|uniref:C40 family peptidase n=1 Tax=Neobacillus sp. LXY-4 TaxID=3379826 RepID=UPI003EDE7B3A
MDLFLRHQMIPEEGGFKLILYLNKDAAEFATELDPFQRSNPENLDHSVQTYIKEKIPKNMVIKTVQIMIGTLLVSTVSLMGNNHDSAAAQTSSVGTTSSTTYLVKAGDTLSGIAKQFQVSVEQLKQTNQLSSDMIRVGQVLTIPNAPASSINQSYTVVAGDSLSLIAKRFGVTVDSLRSTNQLTTDIIRIGQVLMIPSAGSIQLPQPNTTPVPTAPSATTISTTTTYTVVSGDSLWAISARFSTTVDAIKTFNKLTSDQIFIGQKLSIPTNGPTQETTNTNTNTTQLQTTSYTVKSGDSLSLIARQFSTTVDVIKQINQLTSDTIYVGQVISVPTTQNSTPVTTTVDPQVSKLQQQLQQLGYYAVPAMTGNLDTATVQAIKTFQSDYGLPVTGTGDTATLTAVQHAIVKKALVLDSRNYIGVPYLWGGSTPSGFDCSGFIYFMFNKHGVNTTRTTSGSLYTQGISIDRSKLQPGDLVFYAVNEPGVISHVGFYVGENQFISATSSKGIQVVSLDNTYWAKYYVGAKRVY